MLVKQDNLSLPNEDVITYLHRKKKKFNLLTFFRMLIIIIFAIFMLSLYLNYHIRVMKIAYELQGFEKDFKNIQRENEILQIQLARYVSMEHIDDIAINKLGLQRPRHIEFIKVNKRI